MEALTTANRVLRMFGIVSNTSFPEDKRREKEYDLYFQAIANVLTRGRLELEIDSRAGHNIESAIPLIPHGELMDIAGVLGFDSIAKGNFDDPTEGVRRKIRSVVQDVLVKSKEASPINIGPAIDKNLEQAIEDHSDYAPHHVMEEFGYIASNPIFVNQVRLIKGMRGEYYRSESTEVTADAYELVLSHTKKIGCIPVLHEIDEVLYSIPTKDLESFARKHFDDSFWKAVDTVAYSERKRINYLRGKVINILRSSIEAGIKVSIKKPLSSKEIEVYEREEDKMFSKVFSTKSEMAKELFKKDDLWGIARGFVKGLAAISVIYFIYAFVISFSFSYVLYAGVVVALFVYGDRALEKRWDASRDRGKYFVSDNVYSVRGVHGYKKTRRKDTVPENWDGERPRFR